MASSRILNYALLVPRRHLLAASASGPSLSCYTYPFCNVRQNVAYSTKKSVTRIDPEDTENKLQPSLGEVVKENTKTVGYLGVIICGVGITVVILYAVFRELFSSKSPSGVYSKAVERCLQEPKVVDVLGEPIKAFGEETRRGRRTHVSHVYYMKDGAEHLRMQFYLQGTRKRATVFLEVKESSSGDYEYRYLYVKIADMFGTMVKLEDNRDKEQTPNSPQAQPLFELN